MSSFCLVLFLLTICIVPMVSAKRVRQAVSSAQESDDVFGDSPQILSQDGGPVDNLIDVAVGRSDSIIKLLKTVDPNLNPTLRNSVEIVRDFAKLKKTLQCDDAAASCGLDPVKIASDVIVFASKICAELPGTGALVPMLEALNGILQQSSARDPPMNLESLAASLSDRIDKSVREMQTFHVERDIADAKVQAILSDDLRADLDRRSCSESLLSQVYQTDTAASQAMATLLQRAEPLNNNPLIVQAVEGKIKEASEMFGVIVLVETYYKAWHVVANSRFQLLTSAITKFRRCSRRIGKAVMPKEQLEVAAEDITEHLKLTLLQRSAERFQTSSARELWQSKRAAIAEHVVPRFRQEVVEGGWSNHCNSDKYKAWVFVENDSMFLDLVRFAPETCSAMKEAFTAVTSECAEDHSLGWGKMVDKVDDAFASQEKRVFEYFARQACPNVAWKMSALDVVKVENPMANIRRP